MIALAAVSIFFLLVLRIAHLKDSNSEGVFVSTVSYTKAPYIARLGTSKLNIRMIILRHCEERMAVDDADMAIEAVNFAQSEGLDIETIGNLIINGNGPKTVSWSRFRTSSQLQQFFIDQCDNLKKADDTLVVFTIGHGFPNGRLDTLGERKMILEQLATAAQTTNQEILWWQLSCYASARLPSIDRLNPRQQSLISVLATSDAFTESPAYVEGTIMKSLFGRLAKQPGLIDTNGDDQISAGELSTTLSSIRPGRGRYLYSKSPEEIIFGVNLLRRMPIINRNGNRESDPKKYVDPPMPSARFRVKPSAGY